MSDTEKSDADDGENTVSDDDAEILKYAKDAYKKDKIHWDTLIYEKARDDLKILSDDETAQMDEKIYNQRLKTGRPITIVDYLSQFAHQVSNNIKINTPSINPIPAGGKASVDKAEKLKFAIKGIEYKSAADDVYDTAATGAVKCSIGYAFVDHDFAGYDGFDQQLQIKRCINPFLVYPDSNFKECDGRDMMHGTILEKVLVKDFKKDFGDDATICSFDDNGQRGDKAYQDDEEIFIAQFFRKIETDEEETGKDKNGKDVTRKKTKCTIQRYKLSGQQVLKTTTFPGEYVPIVPFVGEEAWEDGERHYLSLIRKAKSAQKSLNLKKSIEDEVLMKQPLAPVMVPAGAIENYKDDWLDPSKSMALRYDVWDAEGRQMPPPQRLNPPIASEGLHLAAQTNMDDIKASMGIYSNSLGQQGQEVSGKAINARKIQADVATYHFGDNTVKSITQIGRIIVCAWNEINDTPREIFGINGENKHTSFGINGHKVDGQDESFDFSGDKYDVRVITGQSYTTVRQESAEFYQDLVKSSPDMIKVCGDLMFENMDIAGAQAMASRMKKLIDPQLLAEEGDEQDPQVAALNGQLQQASQALEQAGAVNQQLEQQLKDKNAAIMAKTQVDTEKNQISKMQIQLDQQASQFDQMMSMMELALKDKQLNITEQNNAGQLALQAQGADFGMLMQMMQRIEAALTQQQSPALGDVPANDGGANQGSI